MVENELHFVLFRGVGGVVGGVEGGVVEGGGVKPCCLFYVISTLKKFIFKY